MNRNKQNKSGRDVRGKSRRFVDGAGKPKKHTGADRRRAEQDVRDLY